MSDFKAEMHKIFDFGWDSAPDPLAVFNGPTSKGREEEEGGKGKRREEEREGEGPAPKYFGLEPTLSSSAVYSTI